MPVEHSLDSVSGITEDQRSFMRPTDRVAPDVWCDLDDGSLLIGGGDSELDPPTWAEILEEREGNGP